MAMYSSMTGTTVSGAVGVDGLVGLIILAIIPSRWLLGEGGSCHARRCAGPVGRGRHLQNVWRAALLRTAAKHHFPTGSSRSSIGAPQQSQSFISNRLIVQMWHQ